MESKSVVVVFLDGVGLGEANTEANPFMHGGLPTVHKWIGLPHLTREQAGTTVGDTALLGLDATLGVSGLPQSATGQTTILTGHNAAALLDEHYGPYPNQPLRELLDRENIFKTLLTADYPVAYANAYPARFLDRLQRGRGRLSANTQAAHRSGLKIRSGEDLRQGRALSALFSNDFWPEPDFPLPPLTPYQAGEQFARLAQDHTLTFFEFWYTDLLGHKQTWEKALETLGMLDDFLAGLAATLDFERTLLLVVSDHGNFEDLTTSKHTLNPALTLLKGQGIEPLLPQLHSLADLKPAILSYLEID